MTYQIERSFMKKFNSALSAAVLLTGIALLGPVTAASASGTPTVVATPTTGLTDGASVTVSGSGFNASDSLYVLECLQNSTGAATCNTSKFLNTVSADASGNVASMTVKVFTGTVGSGTCGTSSTDATCWLVITDALGTDKGYTPITFGAASTTTATTIPTTTTTTTMATTTTTMAKPAAKKTITCVKGKVTKHVTTKACPAGYKKK